MNNLGSLLEHLNTRFIPFSVVEHGVLFIEFTFFLIDVTEIAASIASNFNLDKLEHLKLQIINIQSVIILNPHEAF